MKLSEINAALAGEGVFIPDPDPEHPFEIHESHHAIEGACIVCGAVDYWPLISKPCKGARPSRKGSSATDAARLLRVEWHRFATWWSEREHPEILPSISEWFAEWFEWRKILGNEERAPEHASIRMTVLREALAACEAGRDAGRDAIAILREMARP